jgi:hypothetical protein
VLHDGEEDLVIHVQGVGGGLDGARVLDVDQGVGAQVRAVTCHGAHIDSALHTKAVHQKWERVGMVRWVPSTWIRM